MVAFDLLDRELFGGIVSDQKRRAYMGPRFLIDARRHFASCTFVLFIGRGRESVDVQSVKNGVTLYLLNGFIRQPGMSSSAVG